MFEERIEGVYPYAAQARMVLLNLSMEYQRRHHRDFSDPIRYKFCMVGVTTEELHYYRRDLKKAAQVPYFTTSEGVVNNRIW